MSVIFAGGEIESFDLVGVNQVVNTVATNRYDPDYARMSVEHSGSSSSYVATSFTGVTELWLHLVMVHEAVNTAFDIPIIRFVDSVSGNTVLQLDGDDSIFNLEYWNGASFTEITDSFNFVANEIHTFDIHVKIHDTLGRFALYADNNLLIEFTGDTNLFASSQVDGIELNGPNSFADAGRAAHFSEVIVADESTIGWHVATIVPNADGTTVGQWTGSYLDVDEITNDDGDLLISDTADQLETMGVSNLSVAAAALVSYKALVLQARARRGASGPTQFQFAVRTGGVDYFSSNIALGTGFSEEENLWLVNPDTTNPWTTSEIDAIEMGVKSIA